jgi:hypothetical protein
MASPAQQNIRDTEIIGIFSKCLFIFTLSAASSTVTLDIHCNFFSKITPDARDRVIQETLVLFHLKYQWQSLTVLCWIQNKHDLRTTSGIYHYLKK